MLMFEEYAPHLNQPWLAEAISARYRLLDKPITELFRNDSEIKKIFPEFPDVNSIKEEAALYFVNSDPLLEFAGHPTGPNVIYVGGAHMEHPKPLFEVKIFKRIKNFQPDPTQGNKSRPIQVRTRATKVPPDPIQVQPDPTQVRSRLKKVGPDLTRATKVGPDLTPNFCKVSNFSCFKLEPDSIQFLL